MDLLLISLITFHSWIHFQWYLLNFIPVLLEIKKTKLNRNTQENTCVFYFSAYSQSSVNDCLMYCSSFLLKTTLTEDIRNTWPYINIMFFSDMMQIVTFPWLLRWQHTHTHTHTHTHICFDISNGMTRHMTVLIIVGGNFFFYFNCNFSTFFMTDISGPSLKQAIQGLNYKIYW